MLNVFGRIRHFLQNDESGAVTSEWTVLTALLVAMAASMSPIYAGVNMAADVIESTIELPGNGMTIPSSDDGTMPTAIGTP